jgi:fatty acid desaturase
MRKFQPIAVVLLFFMQVGYVSAQGVRDRCPLGECGGADISPWFYAYIFGGILLVIFYMLIFGNKAQRKDAFKSLLTIVRFVVLFLGIPLGAFLIFGGKNGNGGEAAVISFFAVLLFFVFTQKLSKWAVGERNDEAD